MSFNRRDLLKYFSVGTVISPLAASEVCAKLIEEPKIELVEAKQVPIAPDPDALRALFLRKSLCRLTIEAGDGSYVCHAFIRSLNLSTGQPYIDITNHNDSVRRFIPSGQTSQTIRAEIEFEVASNGPGDLVRYYQNGNKP